MPAQHGVAWQLTPHTLPLLLSTTIAVMVSGLAWKNSADCQRKTLATHILAFALWGSGQLIVLSSTTLHWKIYGTAITGAAIAAVFLTWLVFAFQHTGRMHTQPRVVALLCVVPSLLLAALLTNQPIGNHELVLMDPSLHTPGAATFRYEPGVLAWTGALYLAAIGLTAEYALLTHYLGSPHHRKPSLACLVLGLVVGACLASSLLGIAPAPHFVTTHYVYLAACFLAADPGTRSHVLEPLLQGEKPPEPPQPGNTPPEPRGHRARED